MKAYGEQLGVATIRELQAGGVRAVHFFTLNMVGSVQVRAQPDAVFACDALDGRFYPLPLMAAHS